METAVLISKIIGVIYLSFGIGLLFNKKYYSKVLQELLESTTYLIFGGFLAIIFGLLILEYHNIWSNNWPVIITVVGWAALIKGILLLAFPTSFNSFKPLFKSKGVLNFLTVFVIFFGCIFSYFGFFSN
ncbi:MAG: hypothetical protein GQ540_02990 [Lutibacter sp.]|uniref:hypothetical protein n=1 Tax=Lutibacter sp. TaxID=1925666 RepID=UPI0019F41A3D|nr:hypothetical protein [Lutibacter sp.]NOR27476.1 hypothetical protein [Lutibacter sp.]